MDLSNQRVGNRPCEAAKQRRAGIQRDGAAFVGKQVGKHLAVT